MRNAILALLAAGPAYGYELKQVLDRMFGAVWPQINIGQIYTTLQRLERDGLVVSEVVPRERKADRVVYEITEGGREALAEWFFTTGSTPRLRDDLFMKLALSKRSGVVDPVQVVRRQAEEYLQALSDLDAMANDDGATDGGTRQLLIEGMALHLQADIRWLELWEQALSEEET